MEDSLSYGDPAIRIGRFFWLRVVLSVFYENIPNIEKGIWGNVCIFL